MNHKKSLAMTKQLLISLILLTSYLANTSLAQEENVRPGINDYYYDAQFEDWLDTFERSGREVYDKKDSIIEAMQITKGMKIADIGAGTGLYTIPFAQLVGESGLVYAVDISPDFVKNIGIRAKKNKLNNIIGHINSQKEIGLPNDSINMAFISNTYHHFEYPITTLESIYKSMTKGGKLVIVDFKRDPEVSSSWVMGHVRAKMNKVINEVESVGFSLFENKNILEKNYYLIFTK